MRIQSRNGSTRNREEATTVISCNWGTWNVDIALECTPLIDRFNKDGQSTENWLNESSDSLRSTKAGQWIVAESGYVFIWVNSIQQRVNLGSWMSSSGSINIPPTINVVRPVIHCAKKKRIAISLR